jgi:hypothetical protein
VGCFRPALDAGATADHAAFGTNMPNRYQSRDVRSRAAVDFRSVNVWELVRRGTARPMLYTVFIVLAIIALLLFIFGRRRV